MRISAPPKPLQEIHVGPLIESSIHLNLSYVAIAEFVQECDRSLGWPGAKALELLSAVPRCGPALSLGAGWFIRRFPRLPTLDPQRGCWTIASAAFLEHLAQAKETIFILVVIH